MCSVKFITALDTHVGSCRMPTLNRVPLAGSFPLSVELSSGEQVGGSEYSVEVAELPRRVVLSQVDWCVSRVRPRQNTLSWRQGATRASSWVLVRSRERRARFCIHLQLSV